MATNGLVCIFSYFHLSVSKLFSFQFCILICRGTGCNTIDIRYLVVDNISLLFRIKSFTLPRLWYWCRYNDDCIFGWNRHKHCVRNENSILFLFFFLFINYLKMKFIKRNYFHNFSMALILHGDGICCFKHVRHHHNHNCHSHSTHKDETYHNNNRTKFEYKPLLNESTDKRNGKKALKHNCLHRSPDRSRSNSLSHTITYANSNCSGSNDMIRRNSHGTPTSNSIKMNGFHNDLPSNDYLDIDLKDDKTPIAKDLIATHNCITNGSTICPIHHYVHRDSSEHTPIGSSESEDLHDNYCSRNSFSMVHSYHLQTSNHSHDFASKNINIQAAVIHVLGDFIQSIGVFISAIVIKNYVSSIFIGPFLNFVHNYSGLPNSIYFQPNAKVADPLCTFVFSIIVMMTTCTIMKDSIGIILEAVPNSINSDRLSEDLNCIDGVKYEFTGP